MRKVTLEVSENIENNIVLSANVAIHLNKILQEALQNAIKHSQATILEYTILAGERCEIWFSDDGTGFGSDTANEIGNGLSNMRWRAAEIAVDLHITSVPGQGTRIHIANIYG